MQVSLRASSPGVRGCGREKGKIWLVRFWQLNTRGAIGASFETPEQLPLLLFPPPPPHPRESLLAGYMQVQECPKTLTLELVTLTGGIDECFVRRSKNALKGKYRHRTLDAFLPAKGKESKGFFKQNCCGRALRLSMLFCYKTYKKYFDLQFCFIFSHGRVPACRPGMHALQEKNKRHKPGLGRYVL